jgi:hypothetical protein
VHLLEVIIYILMKMHGKHSIKFDLKEVCHLASNRWYNLVCLLWMERLRDYSHQLLGTVRHKPKGRKWSYEEILLALSILKCVLGYTCHESRNGTHILPPPFYSPSFPLPCLPYMFLCSPGRLWSWFSLSLHQNLASAVGFKIPFGGAAGVSVPYLV